MKGVLSSSGGRTVWVRKQGIKNRCLSLVYPALNTCAGGGGQTPAPEPLGALGDAQGCCWVSTLGCARLAQGFRVFTGMLGAHSPARQEESHQGKGRWYRPWDEMCRVVPALAWWGLSRSCCHLLLPRDMAWGAWCSDTASLAVSAGEDSFESEKSSLSWELMERGYGVPCPAFPGPEQLVTRAGYWELPLAQWLPVPRWSQDIC